tara:strand:- start:1217 stop:1375 length:159 start_codon:yes stop_codon:yes gene_type:complete
MSSFLEILEPAIELLAHVRKPKSKLGIFFQVLLWILILAFVALAIYGLLLSE